MKTIKYLYLLVFIMQVNLIKAQSLDSLLQMVVENNIQLKSIELEYKTILAKKSQVSQLPNPQIGVGIPALRPETRLGPQMVMINASQMFPWFGTLKSKEDVVISMSKAKYEQLAIVKLDLFYQVKTSYYQLFFLEKKQTILKKNIQVYKSIENIALAKVESGESTLADVLRVQTKLQALEQELVIVENQKLIFQSKINELTKQPLSTKIKTDASLKLPLLEYDTSSFRGKIQEYHPLIKQINYQIEESNNSVIVNKSLNKPTIGLGIDYSLVGQRTDAFPVHNGRDILIPKVTVGLPIYRKSYKAKNEEEQFIQESLALKKISLTDKMMTLLVGFKVDYDNGVLEKDLNTNQSKTIKTAYDVLLSKYSASGKGFEELLMVQNQLFDFELSVLMAELKTNIAQANIERIVNF